MSLSPYRNILCVVADGHTISERYARQTHLHLDHCLYDLKQLDAQRIDEQAETIKQIHASQKWQSMQSFAGYASSALQLVTSSLTSSGRNRAISLCTGIAGLSSRMLLDSGVINYLAKTCLPNHQDTAVKLAEYASRGLSTIAAFAGYKSLPSDRASWKPLLMQAFQYSSSALDACSVIGFNRAEFQVKQSTARDLQRSSDKALLTSHIETCTNSFHDSVRTTMTIDKVGRNIIQSTTA